MKFVVILGFAVLMQYVVAQETYYGYSDDPNYESSEDDNGAPNDHVEDSQESAEDDSNEVTSGERVIEQLPPDGQSIVTPSQLSKKPRIPLSTKYSNEQAYFPLPSTPSDRGEDKNKAQPFWKGVQPSKRPRFRPKYQMKESVEEEINDKPPWELGQPSRLPRFKTKYQMEESVEDENSDHPPWKFGQPSRLPRFRPKYQMKESVEEEINDKPPWELGQPSRLPRFKNKYQTEESVEDENNDHPPWKFGQSSRLPRFKLKYQTEENVEDEHNNHPPWKLEPPYRYPRFRPNYQTGENVEDEDDEQLLWKSRQPSRIPKFMPSNEAEGSFENEDHDETPIRGVQPSRSPRFRPNYQPDESVEDEIYDQPPWKLGQPPRIPQFMPNNQPEESSEDEYSEESPRKVAQPFRSLRIRPKEQREDGEHDAEYSLAHLQEEYPRRPTNGDPQYYDKEDYNPPWRYARLRPQQQLPRYAEDGDEEEQPYYDEALVSLPIPPGYRIRKGFKNLDEHIKVRHLHPILQELERGHSRYQPRRHRQIRRLAEELDQLLNDKKDVPKGKPVPQNDPFQYKNYLYSQEIYKQIKKHKNKLPDTYYPSYETYPYPQDYQFSNYTRTIDEYFDRKQKDSSNKDKPGRSKYSTKGDSLTEDELKKSNINTNGSPSVTQEPNALRNK